VIDLKFDLAHSTLGKIFDLNNAGNIRPDTLDAAQKDHCSEHHKEQKRYSIPYVEMVLPMLTQRRHLEIPSYLSALHSAFPHSFVTLLHNPSQPYYALESRNCD
jgi:hypothetical protein